LSIEKIVVQLTSSSGVEAAIVKEVEKGKKIYGVC
jgi:hypothetical protein